MRRAEIGTDANSTQDRLRVCRSGICREPIRLPTRLPIAPHARPSVKVTTASRGFADGSSDTTHSWTVVVLERTGPAEIVVLEPSCAAALHNDLP